MNTVYCRSCGNSVISSMRMCPECGGKSFGPTPPAQANNQGSQGSYQASSSQPSAPLSGIQAGVKGWLLFFCVSLTIITPLFFAAGISREWHDGQQYLDLPGFREALFFEITVFSFFGLYSIFTGVQLWQVKPNAVRNAKRFVLLQAVVAIAVPLVLAAMLGVSFLQVDGLRSTLHGLIYMAIWYPYLLKSKRVKATYP